MEAILFSTGCPRCEVLKKKLQQKGIMFSVPGNDDVMKASEEYGFSTVSQLLVGDKLMDFSAAVKWIGEQ